MNDNDLVMDIDNPEEDSGSEIEVSGMYENWFLDYASYVILERAIPSIYDGVIKIIGFLISPINFVGDIEKDSSTYFGL